MELLWGPPESAILVILEEPHNLQVIEVSQVAKKGEDFVSDIYRARVEVSHANGEF